MLARFVVTALFAGAVFTASPAAQIVAPQPVGITGVVRALPTPPSPPILCAPGTHEIECAEGLFQLHSGTIDLSAYEGMNVKVTAVASAINCPLYDVTEVDTTPPAALSLCGTPGLGCPIRLVSAPGSPSQHFLFVSASPGFVPISVPAGSFMLGEPFLFLDHRLVTSSEGAVFDYNIPQNTQLIGVTAYFQVARRNVGPVGEVNWSNARCMTILGFVLLCHDPSCGVS